MGEVITEAAKSVTERAHRLPTVSIITTAFNARETIADTLISVQAQDYPAIEHIIVDGGSHDGTAELARDYATEQMHIISEPDRGIYDGMNKGIALATGDIIGCLNADDVLYDTGAVRAIAEAFDAETDCVYGNLLYMDAGLTTVTRRWISQPFADGLFQKSWTPAHPTFYCRRDAFQRFGVYRLDFQIAADVELMYRFLQRHQLRSKFIDRYLVRMRAGNKRNRDWRSTLTITREMRQGIRENGGSFNMPVYLFGKMLKVGQLLGARMRG